MCCEKVRKLFPPAGRAVEASTSGQRFCSSTVSGRLAVGCWITAASKSAGVYDSAELASCKQTSATTYASLLDHGAQVSRLVPSAGVSLPYYVRAYDNRLRFRTVSM